MDEVDELLSAGAHDTTEKENEVFLSNRQCELSADAILAHDFGGEEPRPTLPPVCSKLAEVVTDWLRVTPKREKIKEMFREIHVPCNIAGWNLLKSMKCFITDSLLRPNLMIKGCGGLTRINTGNLPISFSVG